MQVEAIELETLNQLFQTMNERGFQAAYPGYFLMAMGFLSVQELRARSLQGKTGGVMFGLPLKHDVARQHPLAGRVFFIRRDQQGVRFVVGHDEACDITISDDSISGRHCQLEMDDGQFFITDLASTNGTRRNLTELTANEPSALEAEDIITVGRYSFQFHTEKSLFDALRMMNAISS